MSKCVRVIGSYGQSSARLARMLFREVPVWLRTTERRSAFGLATLIAILTSGCNGGGFSGEIRVPLEQRHALTAASPATDRINLPGDRTFNIHQPISSRDAGPGGDAKSDSESTPDGTAFCEAKAANGGTASADFLLGHRIENETAARQNAAVQIEFEMTQELRCSDKPAPKTLATGTLNVQILDGHKRSLATVPVAQINSDNAVGSSLNTYRFNLSAVLDPRQNYSFVLQGSVKADGDAGQEAFIRLAVRNLRMRLTFSPAPPESAPASAPASSRG